MFSCHTLIHAKMNTSKRKTCKIIFKTKMLFASAYELTADLEFLQIVNIASLFLYVANCKWYVVLFNVNDFENTLWFHILIIHFAFAKWLRTGKRYEPWVYHRYFLMDLFYEFDIQKQSFDWVILVWVNCQMSIPNCKFSHDF